LLIINYQNSHWHHFFFVDFDIKLWNSSFSALCKLKRKKSDQNRRELSAHGENQFASVSECRCFFAVIEVHRVSEFHSDARVGIRNQHNHDNQRDFAQCMRLCIGLF
jgi:hypothetical protein